MGAMDEAQAWSEAVQAIAKERDLKYDPIGGLNPAGGPAALCPGGTNRLTRTRQLIAFAGPLQSR